MQADQTATTRATEEYHYWEALRTHRGGAYAEAAGQFESLAAGAGLEAVLSRYFAADAHLRAGVSAMRSRRFEQAGRHFRSALRLNPQHLDLRQFLAAALHPEGQAADIPPNAGNGPADPRLGLAMSLWRDGRPCAAIETLRHGLRSAPQRVQWQYHLGVFLGAQEQYEDAIEVLHRALALQPGMASAHMHVGLCHAALAQPVKALHALRRAQRLEPHNARIALLLSMAAGAAARQSWHDGVDLVAPCEVRELAREDVEALTQLFSSDSDVAQAFVALPDPKRGQDVLQALEQALRLVLQRRPQDGALHYHLARVQLRLDDRAGAMMSCLNALEADGDQVQALILLAKLHLENNRPQDALPRLEQVLRLGCEYADVYYLLGCSYRDQGDADRARSSYARALNINSRYRAAREALDTLAA